MDTGRNWLLKLVIVALLGINFLVFTPYWGTYIGRPLALAFAPVPDSTSEWQAVSDNAPLLTQNEPAVEIIKDLPANAKLRGVVDQKSRKAGLITEIGEYAVKPAYTWAYEADEGLAWLKKGRKWGLIDLKGNWLIDPVFKEIQPYDNGYARVKISNGSRFFPRDLWGLIDRQGKWVFEPQFDDIKKFQDGMARVRIGTKYGYINESGRVKDAIVPVFRRAKSFSNGLAAFQTQNADVHSKSRWGFIDKTGKIVITPRFQKAGWFSSGLANVRKNGKWGYIDTKGSWVIKPKFKSGYPFHDGLAFVKKGKKWGYINLAGEMVIPARFDKVYAFNKYGFAPVRVKGKWGYIDKYGNFKIKPQFDKIYAFSENLAPFVMGDKSGYVTDKMEIWYPGISIRYGEFDNGIAPVWFDENESTWGYINKKGELVYDPRPKDENTDQPLAKGLEELSSVQLRQ